jgi:hypothetical protein
LLSNEYGFSRRGSGFRSLLDLFPKPLKPSSAQAFTAQSKTTSPVFITLGEPQAHGDTAEAVPFVRNLPQLLKGQWRLHVLSKFAN